MSNLQDIATADFAEAIADAGVSILWDAPGGTVRFDGLLRSVTPQDDEYDPERYDEDQQRLRALITDVTDPLGNVLNAPAFLTDESGRTLQVRRRRLKPPFARYLVTI